MRTVAFIIDICTSALNVFNAFDASRLNKKFSYPVAVSHFFLVFFLGKVEKCGHIVHNNNNNNNNNNNIYLALQNSQSFTTNVSNYIQITCSMRNSKITIDF